MSKLAPKQQAKLTLLDNPYARDMFADEVVGCYSVHNTFRITFASAKADHTTDPASKSRVVIGRLVMPLAALDDFHKMLTTVLNNKKAQAPGSEVGSHTLQ
jgi:hypothetical protein